MRNRPDSRGRLAGLTPAGSRRPRPIQGEHDDGWFPAPPSARRRSADPLYRGGWVPDVGIPPAPPEQLRRPTSDGVAPADDDAAPPLRTAGPPDQDDPEPADPDAGSRARRVRYAPHHAWGRVAQRWVPEPLRDARVDPGRRGALLLTVVAAVAALVAAVGVWRDQPEARPVQAVSLAQLSDATPTAAIATTGRTTSSRAATSPRTTNPAGGSTGGTVGGNSGGTLSGILDDGTARPTASPEVLIVSVTGAVRHPGLVRLSPGSRVADAIAQAGGVTSAADLTGVNLAARLSDGASVVVSDQPVGGSGSSVSGLGSDGDISGNGGPAATARSGQPVGKVDLNTADAATLDALPGVGPVTAAAIVAWREKNGRYASIEQLQEIPGIGPAKYAALAPLVTV